MQSRKRTTLLAATLAIPYLAIYLPVYYLVWLSYWGPDDYSDPVEVSAASNGRYEVIAEMNTGAWISQTHYYIEVSFIDHESWCPRWQRIAKINWLDSASVEFLDSNTVRVVSQHLRDVWVGVDGEVKAMRIPADTLDIDLREPCDTVMTW